MRVPPNKATNLKKKRRKGDATLYFWSAWVAQGAEPQKLEFLRCNAEKGLPCGSEKFIRKLEKPTGRALQYRP